MMDRRQRQDLDRYITRSDEVSDRETVSLPFGLKSIQFRREGAAVRLAEVGDLGLVARPLTEWEIDELAKLLHAAYQVREAEAEEDIEESITAGGFGMDDE